jgi:probable rRNA maturation factor
MIVTVDVINDSGAGEIPAAATITCWSTAALRAAALDRQPAWQSRPVSVGLRIVDTETSAQLNHDYRGKQNATNVLSFPSDLPVYVTDQLEEYPLGDLCVCHQVLVTEAAEQHKSVTEHWAHLMVHGILHLCGYDHQDDTGAAEMENLEIHILQQLNINNPYIERSINEA